jgi:hypothetical protein
MTSATTYYLLPYPIYSFINSLTFVQVLDLAGLARTSAILTVVDAESAALMLTIVFCILFLSRERGLLFASLRTVQVASLLLCILPIEVYFYDNSAFDEYFVSVQALNHLALWFTNADLLLTSALVFLLSSALVARTTKRHAHSARNL